MKKYFPAILIIMLLIIAIAFVLSFNQVNQYLVINDRPPVSSMYFSTIFSTAILLLCSYNKKDTASIILLKTAISFAVFYIYGKVYISTFEMAEGTQTPCVDLAINIPQLIHICITILFFVTCPLFLGGIYSVISSMNIAQRYLFYGCAIIAVVMMPVFNSLDIAWDDFYYPMHIKKTTQQAIKENKKSKCDKLSDIYYTRRYREIYLGRGCFSYSYERLAKAVCTQSVEASKHKSIEKCIIPSSKEDANIQDYAASERLYIAKECSAYYKKKYPKASMDNFKSKVTELEKTVDENIQ